METTNMENQRTMKGKLGLYRADEGSVLRVTFSQSQGT